MGRRAVRKIDPNLDLSYHLRTVEQLPQPWNPAALFGRESPIELEVGSGKGLFLRRAATTFPDRDFLGIEVAFKYARFAAANLAKRDLKNAIVIHGDALRIVAEYIPDASLHAVHVYFPDPWWKKRHRKRRVMKDTFVRDVERVLVPGGEFHFWTDVEEYFHESLEIIAAHTSLAGPFEVPEAQPEHDLDYRTHFERRMRLAGLPVYRSRFEKR
ncbi:tRNA (guanosine(46)-N7)-methyltransferase TrmB [Thermostilla marina]